MKGYEKLDDVLSRAFKQASEGKGKKRHANDLPFHEQPMQQVNRMVGVGFSHGQAIKKIVESQNMEPEKAVHELLGAICYLAGSIITIEASNDNRNDAPVFETLADVAKTMQKKYEYLDPKTWELHSVFDYQPIGGDWIAVPEGAEEYRSNEKFYKENGKKFYSSTNDWVLSKTLAKYTVFWSRNPLPITRDQAREIT